MKTLLKPWAGIIIAVLCCAGGMNAQATTVDQYIQDAKQYQQKGEYSAAIVQLKNALQKDPKRSQARILLAQSYLKFGNGASAEKELKQAQTLGAEAAQVLPLLAQAYIQQHKYKEVVDKLHPAKLGSPQIQATLLALQGDAYLGLGKNDQAQKKYSAALKLDAGSEAAWLGRTRAALLHKGGGDAAKLVNELVKRFPRSADAWVMKGEYHRQRSEFSAGAAAFKKAIAIEPENINAHLGAAMMLIAEKKYDEGERHLDTVLKIIPRHPLANYLKGVMAYQQHKYSAAEDDLNQVLAVASNYAPAYLLLGAIQYNNGEFEQAAESLKHFLNASPGNLPARKMYAATQLKLKQPEHAIETLDVALKQNGNDPQLLSLMGSAYMQKGDPAKGVEYLKKAAEASPETAKTRTQLALGYLAAGESGQAVSQLQSAVDLGQGDDQADILLILTHLQRHEFDKALKAAKVFEKKQPKSPVAANLMGGAYLGKKDKTAARKQFEKALQLDPSFTPAHANLAKIDEAEGDMAAAKRHYQAILDKDDKNLEALLGMARLAERAGNQEEVLQWLQQARNKVPDAVGPGVLLAKYYLAHDEPLKALSVTQDMTSRNPDNPLALEIAGEVQLANKQISNAIASYRHLADVNPKSAQAYYLLAAAQVRGKDLDSALDNVNKALDLHHDFPAATVMLAAIRYEQGHKQEALSIARRLQKQHPEMGAGYEVEGNIQLKDGKFGEAAKAYESAFKRGASAGLARKLYGVRRKLGRADASDALLKWVKLHPEDMTTTIALASAYQVDKRYKDAMIQYERVLKKQPDNAVVLNNLAWLYNETGDKRAVEYAERAYKLKPDEPAIIDTLGWMLVQHGQSKRAVTLLQEASMRAPHLPEIRYHMAVALEKVGRKQEARQELERLINGKQDFAEIDSAKRLLKKIDNE